jgi:hypothetical protein
MRDQTMLSVGESCQLGLRPHFFPHSGNKCDRDRFRPQDGWGERLFARIECT